LLKEFLPNWIKRSQQRLERRLTLHEKLKEILYSNEVNKEELINLAFRNYVDSSFENLGPVVSFLQKFSGTLTPEQIAHLADRKSQLLELLESFNKAQF
jgi:predicted nucleotide-binding protein (sugar kinase/HSP70/actin superfamily)